MLSTLETESVDCIVTSPPYWGLRDYGVDGQIGLEPTLEEFLDRLELVFLECQRVLKSSGTLWVNMGDSYSVSGGPNTVQSINGISGGSDTARGGANRKAPVGIPQKSMIGVPWRLALRLVDHQGWTLRQEIIWHKPNPMPESVRDRPTRAHEQLFFFTKAKKYWYDSDAICEPCSPNTHARLSQDAARQIGSHRANGGTKTNGTMKAVGGKRKQAAANSGTKNNESFNEACVLPVSERNSRSVWSIPTQGFSGAHFATFPAELPRRCILAGCPPGGVVLDPFAGSGTVLEVALSLGRDAIGIELNPEYAELIRQRLGLYAPELEVTS